MEEMPPSSKLEEGPPSPASPQAGLAVDPGPFVAGETPPEPSGGRRSLAGRAAEGVLALALVAGGLLGAWAILRSAPRAPEEPAQPPRSVPVETILLERGPAQLLVRGTGTLEPEREANLALEAGGEVVWVHGSLRPGVWVEAGEPLLRLDPRPLELELQALGTTVRTAQIAARAAEDEVERATEGLELAKERVELATSDEARWLALQERGVSDEARLDAARSARVAARSAQTEALRALDAARSGSEARALEIRLAEERAELVRDRIGRLELRAPFAGRFVGRSSAAGGGNAAGPAPRVGEVLAPFASAGGLVDTSALRARVAVHADDLARLDVGAPARVRPAARPELVLRGAVASLGPRVDPRTRSVDVEVRIELPPESDVHLPAGSFASVELYPRALEDALTVDDAWVAHRGGAEVLFVVAPSEEGDGHVVREVPVRLGRIAGSGRVLIAGPPEGARIATSPLQLLGDGTRVVPEPAPGTADADPSGGRER